jgi:hypothetical protein
MGFRKLVELVNIDNNKLQHGYETIFLTNQFFFLLTSQPCFIKRKIDSKKNGIKNDSQFIDF